MTVLFRVSDKSQDEALLDRGREVIRIEAEALHRLDDSLDGSFIDACRIILAATRRIVVTGMGKSGHIGRKLAATLSATGTPAMFIHPAEAGHGDLGMLMAGDVLLVLSNSGNTTELRAILDYARGMHIKIIGVASHRASLVMDFADVAICLPTLREACAANIAPTTSTTLQLALGDAMALAVMDARGISKTRLRALHPAGTIGMRLTPISELMHVGDQIPLVAAGTGMPDVISVMTRCRFGLAGVVNDRGELIGAVTDGDLRRHFSELNSASAGDVMTSPPKSIASEMLASDALMFLNDAKITAAFVVNRLDTLSPTRPVGIVHIHDLLQYGLN
ncbi:MAG: KpsF/GutQ family sugar-phosphate isomerase [Pseudomonadota bacterium]|nr:KpsF/GutQ family sugar-phosphate isomerase [Pseudomonadota bacterium]